MSSDYVLRKGYGRIIYKDMYVDEWKGGDRAEGEVFTITLWAFRYTDIHCDVDTFIHIYIHVYKLTYHIYTSR